MPFEIRDARDSDATGMAPLLTELGHAATETGVRELTSAADRDGAHRFYRGLGYREEGVRFAKEIDR